MAAHAVVYDGRGRRILLGHIGHHLGGDIAGLSGPFQGIGLHVLAKARELGHVALAVYGELAFQRRDRALGGMGHCRVRRFVPHIKGLQLHRLAGFRIGARHHVGKQAPVSASIKNGSAVWASTCSRSNNSSSRMYFVMPRKNAGSVPARRFTH